MASNAGPTSSAEPSSAEPTLSPEEKNDVPGHDKQPNEDTAGETSITGDIDPANEIQGLKLILIHLSVCLCTFLVGLVGVTVF